MEPKIKQLIEVGRKAGQLEGRTPSEGGFTLIELMIVIAIIGILAAIAIPQYTVYRKNSHNATALHDLRQAMNAQEYYFLIHKTYCSNTTTLIGSTYMLHMSEGVTLQIDPVATNTTAYLMRARHSSGDTTYVVQGPGGAIRKE